MEALENHPLRVEQIAHADQGPRDVANRVSALAGEVALLSPLDDLPQALTEIDDEATPDPGGGFMYAPTFTLRRRWVLEAQHHTFGLSRGFRISSVASHKKAEPPDQRPGDPLVSKAEHIASLGLGKSVGLGRQAAIEVRVKVTFELSKAVKRVTVDVDRRVLVAIVIVVGLGLHAVDAGPLGQLLGRALMLLDGSISK